MSFTAEHELLIRSGIVDKLTTAGIGYPLPSPIPFVDKADFWATVGSLNDTQKLIETELVTFCVVSLRKFEDLMQAACEDQPLIRLTYNLYLFRETNAKRVDETATPNAFNKKLLLAERNYLADMFNIRSQFVGLQSFTGLPAGYDVTSLDIAMDAFARENEICRYVPEIRGFSADLQTVVDVLIQ